MSIDLNLQNYTTLDIERLFGLPMGYTPSEIQQKEHELSIKLTKTSANPKFKEDIISFLRAAKEKLVGTTSINPIHRTEIKRLLCIDSMFRPHYDATKSHDFMYFMPDYIKNVTALKILSVELPTTWYHFSKESLNSTFTIKFGTNPPELITIPDGNYTSDGIIKLLNVLFDELNTTLSYTMDITTAMNPFTTKIIFQSCSNTPFTLNFETDGASIRNTCGINLGFMKQVYEIKSTPASIEAEVMYGSNIDHYVFIDIDDFQRNFLSNAVVSVVTSPIGVTSYIGNTIMAKIPLTTYTYTVFNNGNDLLFKTRSYFGPVNLEKMRIRLLNRFGNYHSLDNSNYSLSIEITELY